MPIRSPSIAQAFVVLNPIRSGNPSYIERYKSFNVALQGSEEFSPIFLNDLCPHDARQLRYYLDNLPKGLTVNGVKFSHAYGKHLGTLPFILACSRGDQPE